MILPRYNSFYNFLLVYGSSVQSCVPEFSGLWFFGFFGTDDWLVTSVDFYPENQHQFLDLPRCSLLALPGLIDFEDFSCESRSQPDVFQTQKLSFRRHREQELRRVS
jgi:hypothetical protein